MMKEANQKKFMDRLLTAQTAADILVLSPAKVYNLMDKGEIRTVHIGRNKRITQEDLIEFIKKRTW